MCGWYIAKNQKKIGPLSEDRLIQGIKCGKFVKGALVWKKGLSTWEPIEAHFPSAIKEAKTNSHREEEANPETIDIHPQEEVGTSQPITAFYQNKLLWHGLLSASLFCLFLYINKNLPNADNLVSFSLLWGGSLVAAIISAVFLVRKAGKIASKRILETKGKSGGTLKLSCTLGGVIVGVFALFYAVQAPLIFKVSKARKAYEKYQINVDVASDSIRINGVVGPKLSKRIEDSLDVHAGIKNISITSPGGLLDEALEAAKIIESYKGLTVVAREECNSACLVILMAGERRAADWNMKLGFHAASPIANIEEEYLDIDQLSDEADAYLAKRGVPQEIIDYGYTKGADSLELVPSIKLAETGAISALLDGNQVLTLSEAKWKSVENAVESIKTKSLEGFSDVLRAIRETSPDIVREHANNLYEAYQKAEASEIRQAVSGIIKTIVPIAMQAADGEELYNYMDSNLRQAKYLIKMENWQTCANYFDGQVSSELNVMSHSFLREEFESLSQLIRSAGNKDWKAQPIPRWAESRGQSIIEAAVQKNAKRGMNIENFETDNKTKCIITYTMMHQIMGEGREDAPPIIRWLNTL